MVSIYQNLRNTIIGKYKFILIFWALILIAAVPFLPLLFENLELNPEAPSSSDSTQAMEIIEAEFPDSQNANHIILLQMNDGSSILNPTVQQFTIDFSTKALANEKINDNITPESIAGYFLINGTIVDQAYPELKYQFVSSDQRITYIAIETDDQGDFELSRELFEEIQTIIKDDLLKSYTTLSVTITGFTAMDIEAEEAVLADMERIDIISIPLVIIALALILRNPRLTFVPLLGIVMTLLISFSILGLLAANVTILNFVPNVMLSLGLGIGVDYSLFLLSRFNEERRKNVDVTEAIASMLTHTGHTILVSGLTLAISFTGLIIFPISVFSSVGIAITITVLVSLAINLTFVPALLRFAGRWFTPYKQVDVKTISKENSSYWKNFANFSTKYAVPILVIITIIAIPVSVQTFNMTQSLDTFEMLPENLESREGYEILLNEFDAGLISPMTMVFKSSDINGVWSEEFFNTSQELIQDMINTGDVDGEKIMCHTWMRGEAIPYALASASMSIATLNETEKMAALAYYPTELHTILLLYPAFATEFVNENGSTAILPVVLSIDPFSPEAHDWIIDVRDNILPSFNEFESYDIHIGGLSATLVDVSEVTYSYFPIMILAVLLLIGFLVGFMYKSVFVPIRLLATILLTISFNYGLAVLFFEEHWGAFLKPSITDLTGLFFMVPVMTFSILIGLGMDYDLFILGRIKEGVWKGKSTREAIADALHHTGGVVTGAALIMVLAFGGLMLSSSMMLVELGFLLAIAVAIDATIVRTLLVPAIMSLAEKTNWWPAKVP